MANAWVGAQGLQPAADPIGDFRVATLSYSGNSVAGRVISLGLPVASQFTPRTVFIIRDSGDREMVWKSDTMPTNTTLLWNADADVDLVTAFGLDTFTVTADARVNATGNTYHVIAIAGDAKIVDLKTYAGDSVDNRIFTGYNFSPDIIFIKEEGASARHVIMRHKSWGTGDKSQELSEAQGSFFTNLIQDIHSNGFELGTDARVNASGSNYHVLAVRSVESATLMEKYTGNSIDNRNIAFSLLSPPHTNFTPKAVLVKGDPSTADNRPYIRPDTLAGDNAFQPAKDLPTFPGTKDANAIQLLSGSGFQVGTLAEVNDTGDDYYFWAIADALSGTNFDRVVPLQYRTGLVIDRTIPALYSGILGAEREIPLLYDVANILRAERQIPLQYGLLVAADGDIPVEFRPVAPAAFLRVLPLQYATGRAIDREIPVQFDSPDVWVPDPASEPEAFTPDTPSEADAWTPDTPSEPDAWVGGC